MKKAMVLIIFAVIISLQAMVFAGGNGINVIVDGDEVVFDVPPQVINDRTMVPLRKIFEALGATVNWESSTKTVIAVKNSITIQATIGNNVMYVNNTAKTMDVAPIIIDDRTLVPIRFIAEAYDCNVDWDGKNETVYISTEDYNTAYKYDEDISEKTYTLKVKDNSHGYVSVINDDYVEGTEIYINASPKAGYEFKKWKSSGGGSFEDAESEDTIFTMPANDVVIRASFAKIETYDDDESYNYNTDDDKSNNENIYDDNDNDNSYYEYTDTDYSSYITYYDEDPLVPTFESITGASFANGASLAYNKANYRTYFYKSSFEQKDMYEEYLLNNGWMIKSSSVVADDVRYKCTGTTYCRIDNPEEKFHLYIYENCIGGGYDDGDVDITVYEK